MLGSCTSPSKYDDGENVIIIKSSSSFCINDLNDLRFQILCFCPEERGFQVTEIEVRFVPIIEHYRLDSLYRTPDTLKMDAPVPMVNFSAYDLHGLDPDSSEPECAELGGLFVVRYT